jgi:hypothetical protein
MDSQKLIKWLKDHNAGIRVAINKKRNAIGYWSKTLDRWQILYGMLLTNEWVNMPELLIGGKPLIAQEDWEEVSA